MDHAEARELLELSAVEPDGFERLFAGDTPEAAALAGHLAGCPACSAYVEAVRRDSLAIRDAIRTMPPPELRERTLAYVAALGRDRSGVGEPGAVAAADVGPVERPATVASRAPAPPVGGAIAARRTSAGWPLAWVAALAAAVVLAVAGTGLVLNSQQDRLLRERDAALAAQSQTAAALARVAEWSVRVGAAPDARSAQLTSPSGAEASGTLVFSPSTGELVVVATDLAPPPPGTELACWVESGGVRRRVGQMFFGSGLAYWAGPVSGLDALGPDATFGVSPAANGGEPGDPVLVGDL